MRKFKTAEDNRTNYIYYFDDGSKCVITPGENGENTTIISQLHAMDDEQLDADRREDYHCPVHYQAYSDGEGEDADDRNPYLCDTAADPLEQMLASINEQEHSDKLDRLKAALTTLTDLAKPGVTPTPAVRSGTVQIRKRLLDFLFGQHVNVLVLSPGDTVQTVEIRELKEGGKDRD